jgi:hypothetical protein
MTTRTGATKVQDYKQNEYSRRNVPKTKQPPRLAVSPFPSRPHIDRVKTPLTMEESGWVAAPPGSGIERSASS